LGPKIETFSCGYTKHGFFFSLSLFHLALIIFHYPSFIFIFFLSHIQNENGSSLFFSPSNKQELGFCFLNPIVLLFGGRDILSETYRSALQLD
jgi:hypothetical protein